MFLFILNIIISLSFLNHEFVAQNVGDFRILPETRKAYLIQVENEAQIAESESIFSGIIKKAQASYDDEYNVLAKSAFVLDCANNDFLFNQEASKKFPIASITKLMTALVFLDHNPGWETIHKIKAEDRVEGGKIYLFQGEEVTVRDLFYTSLVASANTATMALVHSTGMSEEEFVQKMNEKAQELKLKNTSFSDVVGFSRENLSTAKEIAKFTQVAFAQDVIQDALSHELYEFSSLGGRVKKVRTTDFLLHENSGFNDQIIGGKTGYTDAAGYCFVGKFKNEEGNDIISVVLGSTTNSARFNETKKLVNWIYHNYEWK